MCSMGRKVDVSKGKSPKMSAIKGSVRYEEEKKQNDREENGFDDDDGVDKWANTFNPIYLSN